MTPRHEDQKIRHKIKILSANEHAPHVYKFQVYRRHQKTYHKISLAYPFNQQISSRMKVSLSDSLQYRCRYYCWWLLLLLSVVNLQNVINIRKHDAFLMETWLIKPKLEGLIKNKQMVLGPHLRRIDSGSTLVQLPTLTIQYNLGCSIWSVPGSRRPEMWALGI
jgi:hypothetical protein